MTAEQGDPEDLGHMPSMSSKTREMGKLQDIYRRTLAATWNAQVGELPADKCIEDIFAGGDGWAKDKGGNAGGGRGEDGDDSDGDNRTIRGHQRISSGYKSPRKKGGGHARTESGNHSGSPMGAVSGRASIEQVQDGGADTGGYPNSRATEIDEFTAREDLRSWEIRSHLAIFDSSASTGGHFRPT